jgi:hypothetical protein
MQGAQKLRSEAHLQVRRSDEVEAQRRRWTFYETIKIYKESRGIFRCQKSVSSSLFNN